jgi:integration host factor subunit beta
MFDAGKSIVEIANAEHLTPTWICSILDATGVRQKGKRSPGIPLGEMPEIVQLNASGWSLREIGDRYGVSGEAIRQAIITWPKRKKRAAIAKRRELARIAKAAWKIPRLSKTTEYTAAGASAARRRIGPNSPRAPRAGGGMIGADLIDRLSERRHISLHKATSLVAAFFECIAGALRRGERVEIRGFGVFTVRNYEGHRGRNPRTGQAVEVKPMRVPFFKASREFLKRLNAGRGDEERQVPTDEVVAKS